MNQNEKFKLKNKLIQDLKTNGGYVKGFGPKLCRVMDKDHNPLYNIDREVVEYLYGSGQLKLDGLIYKINLEN